MHCDRPRVTAQGSRTGQTQAQHLGEEVDPQPWDPEKRNTECYCVCFLWKGREKTGGFPPYCLHCKSVLCVLMGSCLMLHSWISLLRGHSCVLFVYDQLWKLLSLFPQVALALCGYEDLRTAINFWSAIFISTVKCCECLFVFLLSVEYRGWYTSKQNQQQQQQNLHHLAPYMYDQWPLVPSWHLVPNGMFLCLHMRVLLRALNYQITIITKKGGGLNGHKTAKAI